MPKGIRYNRSQDGFPFIMPSTESPPRRIDRVLRFAGTAMLVARLARSASCCSRSGSSCSRRSRRTATEIAQWLGARIGQPVEIDAVADRLGRLEPQARRYAGFACATAPRLRRRCSISRASTWYRVDVAATAGPAPQGTADRFAAALGAPRRAGAHPRRRRRGRHESTADDSAFADWLLRQPRVLVRDALVVWNDEYRNAPS